MDKKISFFTLGCKLNFAESSAIIKQFTDKGYRKVRFGEPADVSVINTCTVTSQADKKSRQAIKKAVKKSGGGKVVVVGCSAQLHQKELAEIEGVTILAGADNKQNVFELLQENPTENKLVSCEILEVNNYQSAYSVGDRTRSFLKVQDGCDYVCTYCTIPLARGKSRNTHISEIIKQAKEIASQGFKEVVLTGVNIGDFGKSTGETFFRLIKELDKVAGIERFRISSIEPNLLTSEMIEFIKKSDKFLPHFHIPLQAGSDKVLALMKRRYNTTMFRNKILEIKKNIPDAFLGIDVIAGFPQETDEDFEQTYSLLESLPISYLHIFPYSVRENTPAAEMPNHIHGKIIAQRTKKLKELSDKKHAEFYQKHIGTVQTVLFENQRIKNKIFGFTENYIKVETEYRKELANRIVKVKLERINENGNVKISFV